MKKTLLSLMCGFFALAGLAQQEIQSTHFMLNPFLLNPAFSSIDDNLDFKMGYRNQWVGIEGAPVTSYSSIHSPIGKPRWGRTHPGDFHNWHGAGAFIMQDNIGAYRTTRFNANYSYNLKIHEGGQYGYSHNDGLRFALGMHVGWYSYQVDRDILGMSKTSDGRQIANNPSLNDVTYQDLTPITAKAMDLTFGGLLYYNEKYFVGFSTSQLLESEVSLTANNQLERHYFISGMIKHQVAENFYVIPAAIFKMVGGAPLSYNLMTRVDYIDRWFLGFGYRSGDAVTFMAGTRIKWGEKVKHFRVDKHRYVIQVYYSFDHTISRLGNNKLSEPSVGSHELTLGFLLPPMYRERNAEDTWKF